MYMVFLIGVVSIFLSHVPVFAGPLETVIASPAAPQAGEVAEFFVYVHNTGDAVTFEGFPAQVSCLIKTHEGTVEVVAMAAHPFPEMPALLGKGAFLKVMYTFFVPEDLEGPVHMDVPEIAAVSVMFAVAPKKPETTPPDESEPESEEAYPSLDALFSLYQPYLANLTAYESMYFLVGTNPEKSKFQISFKYRFLDPEGGFAEDLPWARGLHFGYTQTSFWDLKSDSAPFEDTSYKPEFFYLTSNIAYRPSWVQGFFLQTGFQHESNGRGGDLSRSTNFLYAKPVFILYDESTQLGLQIAPKVWAYVNNADDTNPDLEDYRGFFDLELKLGKANSFVLESHLRWAKEGASTQLDLTYPLHLDVLRNLGFYLQVQYVNALAESLIDYRGRNEALRLGLAIVR